MQHTAFALLALSSSALAQGAATQLISATAAGGSAQATGIALSPEGRFVAFGSYSAQIVPGDSNGNWDVFLKDRVQGSVQIVSLSSAGTQGHPVSALEYEEMGVSIACSRDARLVAFTSSAPDLVPGDTNAALDVFVRDRVTGTTTLASGAPGGAPSDGHAGLLVQMTGGQVPGTFYRSYPTPLSITADGRFLAFASAATNLVALDANAAIDVFVRDLQTGVTELVSASSAGVAGDNMSIAPSLSADGRFVAFQSLATNLVPGDTNQRGDVFVRDRLLGTTERVSVASNGAQSNGHSSWFVTHLPPGVCHHCPPVVARPRSQISADGRWVAFWSESALLDPGAAGSPGYVYLHDRVAHTTRNLTPLANGPAADPSLSADGRYVALISAATNLGPTDTNPNADVYRLDLALGAASIESVDALGAQAAGASQAVVLAEDGEQLAFVTSASLAPGDAPTFTPDAYARGAPAGSFTEDCEGTAATCPCANAGASGHGCANSVSAAGARLIATGRPQVSADSLVLTSSGEPATASTLFVQSSTSSPSSAATSFGDGVLCLTGSLRRLATRAAQHGVAQLGVSGDPHLAALGGIPASGTTVHYQAVYRNLAAFCTADAFNTSNSITVTWMP